MSVTTTTSVGRTILTMDSAYGTIQRSVSTAPPREATREEIPLIDVSGIYSENIEDRKAVATQFRDAAINTGFFYIKNHGVDSELIDNAYQNALRFFHQPEEIKKRISKDKFKFFNGYSARYTTHGNKTESTDRKEHIAFQYQPELDPAYDSLPHPIPLSMIPEEMHPWLKGEPEIWEGVSNLPGFKEAWVAYYRSCLTLARSMTRTFALALELPENYFDDIVTYPGADATIAYYPGAEPGEKVDLSPQNVGLGSHTDNTGFTLLWQDMVGGLLVLNRKGEWIKASPIPDTFVVNIADFFQRMTNDRWVSTVHKVEINRSPEPRISMPFFFGENPSAFSRCPCCPNAVYNVVLGLPTDMGALARLQSQRYLRRPAIMCYSRRTCQIRTNLLRRGKTPIHDLVPLVSGI
ncbi:hypothetical protein A1O1_06388 [Capronia coronata CBS 617.96]|uniref:Fe2OG dioxygenase domain-containing protein n=1 Tax=Capronia coronata CBS 617.96 TaxID=1182541 RepID=W9YUR0_9EURO|nr:uncharacterized protein A1O1_06388 [Capronia coronata CBS 617.96]EXJ86019.1 hypothetical protein A1O1_06388 [Capronia coronata CBS 617.96]